jgi:hypothetical protein
VPSVLRVAELSLRQLIEPLLLTPEHVELVLAFLGIRLGGVERCSFAAFGRRLATKQPSEEAHLRDGTPPTAC